MRIRLDNILCMLEMHNQKLKTYQPKQGYAKKSKIGCRTHNIIFVLQFIL